MKKYEELLQKMNEDEELWKIMKKYEKIWKNMKKIWKLSLYVATFMCVLTTPYTLPLESCDAELASRINYCTIVLFDIFIYDPGSEALLFCEI